MTAPSDLRRHVAHVTIGGVGLMLVVQATLEDAEGAVAAGQWRLAAAAARETVLTCLYIQSLAVAGEPGGFEDMTTSDPFAGLPDEVVAAALALVREAPALRAETAGPWLERLRAVVAETERGLGLGAPVPRLRSPEGMFAALALARSWLPAVRELGLPAIFPEEWTTGL